MTGKSCNPPAEAAIHERRRKERKRGRELKEESGIFQETMRDVLTQEYGRQTQWSYRIMDATRAKIAVEQ